MGTSPESKFENFKKVYTKYLRWILPTIAFIADVITIAALLGFQAKTPQSLPSNVNSNPQFSPPIFGSFTLDDAVFLTGLFTAFVIATMIYVVITKRKDWGKYPFIVVTVISILLVYFYFRLWLGEKWWLYFLFCIVAPILLTVFWGIASFFDVFQTRSPLVVFNGKRDNRTSEDQNQSDPSLLHDGSQTNYPGTYNPLYNGLENNNKTWVIYPDEINQGDSLQKPKQPNKKPGVWGDLWYDLNQPLGTKDESPQQPGSLPNTQQGLNSSIKLSSPPEKPSILQRFWKDLNTPLDDPNDKKE